MEEMMMTSKKQTWGASTTTTNPCSNALALHRDSQTISKPKPKIRIIHIFAPEIIKTDVANFRELVQRLTGKPSDNNNNNNHNNNKRREPRRESEAHHQRNALMAEKTKTMEMMRSTNGGGGGGGFEQFPRSERVIKEEEMMWNADKTGGFLERFADFEGFIQELGEYPMLPNLDSSSASSAANSHLLHGFEGTQLV